MPCYHRAWADSRGDEHDAWGHSEWWFDVDDQGYATRQIEVYVAGPVKRYSRDHPEDESGWLTTEPFDVAEWLSYLMEPAAFEKVWRADL